MIKMENLTNQQVVLLMILVCVVTSIATGIVTVFLMDKETVPVTQTINKVVERTIEKVVSDPSSKNSDPVIITIEDQVAKASDIGIAGTVKISKIMNYETSQTSFVSFGTIINKDGLIITDRSAVGDSAGRYVAETSDGSLYDLRMEKNNSVPEIALMTIIVPDVKKKDVKFQPLLFADSKVFKPGQSIVLVSGKNEANIYQGIIQNVNQKDEIATSTDLTGKVVENKIKKVSSINTNISPEHSLLGTPILNLNGEIVGIKVSSLILETTNPFLPSNILKKALN